MILEVSAQSNTTGTVSLICNNKQISKHDGTVFLTSVVLDDIPKNVLDIKWHCVKSENVHLKINHVLLNEQKLDIHKSMYIPSNAPKGYNSYISHHCGKLVWPGTLRFYFQIIKQNNYIQRKQNESHMLRKYNIVYD